MKNIVNELLNQIKEDKQKRRKSCAVMLVLSLLVASGVLWQMKITGITMTGEALCGHLEHQHTTQCLGMQVVCGLEESEGHSHTDACKASETVQICQKEEHTHVEGECYVLDVSECGREEHEHGDACFEIKTSLTCGQEEHEGHKHTDDCKREAYGCGYEKEHKHTLLCYSDVNADLETASNWEKLIPALNRKPAEDLAMVARSQIGYTESQRNYKVAEDGVTKQGYTRYGEWYGNPYGDWNAMFVSFCLHYAEHPAYETLKNSGAESMRLAAEQAGVYQAAAGTIPYVGDLAFLDKNSNGSCDTVAIVSGREEGGMTLVEGDCGGAVAENRYSLDNGTVLGYALLTPQTMTTEELDDELVDNTVRTVDAEPIQDGNITITFVIDQENYTYDPGSGNTHVTVNLTTKDDPAGDGFSSDGGLRYTYCTQDGTKFKHTITGTGTLMTRSIRAGTTLEDSGYSLPVITAENIDNTNTYSYLSSLSWVTGGGMICNKKTEFAEDTTLYLRLYESGTSCGLNWVCNCNSGGAHSVTAYVSGFDSPTFAWGQSVSNPYIPTAEAVNSKYTGSRFCTAGPDHGMQFAGWFVKDSSGKEIEFGAGVPILEDYKDPYSDGYSVKVYARWEEAEEPETPVTVRATFVNGTEKTEKTLNKGEALGENLPVVTAPDDKIFVGWKIGETETYATAETVLSEDTTFTAVFVDKVTVTFKNGEETVETRYLAVNTAVGELPEVTASDKAFLGWQAEGMSDYAAETTVITANTTFHAVFAEKITVTLMNGETEFRILQDIPKGAVLWNYLPEEKPEYTRTAETAMAFAGWGWTDAEQTEHIVTEETVADTDMVLHAVFEEVSSYAVYLHDIAPDGITDYETGGQDIQVSQTALSVGMSLADALAEDPYRMLHDDALASDCLWYIKKIVDGQETYVSYDLAEPVTSDIHLYTFSYSLTLSIEEESVFSGLQNLFTVASAAEIKVNGNQLTLTLRQGEKPTAADFVVNGVDYTLYNWTVDGKTLNIRDIIENGVTENIVATSHANSLAITPSATGTKTINFYVFVDEQRVLVETRTVTSYRFADGNANGARWYIPAATLESVYGKYGFVASQLTNGTRYFPHVDTRYTTIWADTPVYENNGVYFSPVINHDGADCNVYYLPKQSLTASSDYTNYLTTETFYSITVSDSAKLIYSETETVPGVQYVITGGTVTVTLKDPAEGNSAYWMVNGTRLTGGTPNNDGTTTYTFSNVTQRIRIAAYKDNMYDISYDINLDSYTPTSTAPTINGFSEYSEMLEILNDGSYIIRTPSRTQFTISGTNSLQTVVFKGWAANGNTTTLLQPGDVLTAAQLKQQYGSSVNLAAQWETKSFTDTVSFYVNLKLEIIDYDGTSAPVTSDNDYTSALYGTAVTISPKPSEYPSGNSQGAGGGVVLVNDNTAVIDAQLRQFETGSITAKYGNTGDYTEREFSLATFPDDEHILEKIRAVQTTYIASYQQWRQNGSDINRDGLINTDDYHAANPSVNKIIAIDGEYIPVEEITVSNYTIRWIVFKYDSSNGWHIDGTLIKKQGQITVNKTFYGHAEAITDVKDNPYTITVKDAQDNMVTTLNLNQKSDRNPTGWEEYDATTDTYTWVVPLTADKTFTFFENNYKTTVQAGGETVATLAEYMVTNTASDVNRTDYDENQGVSVTAKAHSVDQDHSAYETVTFYNGYIPAAAVPISKVDDYGNSLTGVSFSLYKNDEKCTIYQDTAGIYYIYKPTEGIQGSEWNEVPSGYITVNAQGYAMVMGLKDVDEDGNYSNYTFKLEESVAPEGYAPIDDIEFVITENGSIQLQGTSGAALVDGNLIRVTNASKTMDITVVKEWEGESKEVQVQLTQNGTPLASKTATLNDENGWTHTWENLPIYVSGAVAEYSIRENWIGNTAYQGNFDDGYENYIVTVTSPITEDTDGDGLPESATITVTNRVYEGGLVFKKVDETGNPLEGAMFHLFKNEACTQLYDQVGMSSDVKGNVNFGFLPAGTYYMKEVRTPAGYQENTTVYKIAVTGSGTTITVADDETNTPISTIVNIPATASLKVKKVDGSGKPLTGASFEVYMKDSEGVYSEKITREINGVTVNKYWVDTAGLLTVPDLMPGDYKLVEVDAPDGYYRMTEDIEFNVALAAIVARDTDTDNSWSFDGTTITVVNVAGSELPHTGGMGTHFGTMAGLLMMASSLLYGFLLRRKRERGAV